MVRPQHLYATINATIHAFFADYPAAAQHNNPSLLSAHLTPDCLRFFGPPSFLQLSGISGPFNNTAYEAGLAPELGVTASNGFTVSKLVIDDAHDASAAALTTYHTTLCGQPPIDLQLSWFFDLTADGRRISRMVEIVDPGPTLNESLLAVEVVKSGVTCKKGGY